MSENHRTDADPAAEADDLSLEDRLGRLEAIMAQLEADEVPLEKALELFEEGVGHVRAAERVLAETELRVEELLADGSSRDFTSDDA